MSSSISHGEKEKLDRKTLKRPDKFTETVSGLFTELSKHQRIFLGLVALVLALGLIGTVLMQVRSNRAEDAKNALFEAEKILQTELKSVAESLAPVASPRPEKATETKPDLNKVEFARFDVDARLPEGVKKLKLLSDRELSAQTTFEARMQLGELYLRHGEPAQAVSWFEKAEKAAPGTFGRALALSSLGYAWEAAGDYARAAAVFQRAIDMGEASLKADLLFSIARNRVQAKDVAKAREAYDQILTQYPGTEQARQAELLKSKLN